MHLDAKHSNQGATLAPSSPTSVICQLAHVDQFHRATFASVLAEIPMAAMAFHHAIAKRPSPPRTVFVLDWDDTCCATSFLERHGFMADLDTRVEDYAPDLATYLHILEHRVLSLLKTAIRLGIVLIVTNAGDGWVEMSSGRFLPAVRAFLEEHYKSIKIISARARYVDMYRQNPLRWKALTFSEELRAIFEREQSFEDLHAIVLGDSVGDQYAAHFATNTLKAAGYPMVLKVVKFLERPSIDQLCKELSVLLDHIEAMTLHRGSFDVSMYKEAPPMEHHQQQRHHSNHNNEMIHNSNVTNSSQHQLEDCQQQRHHSVDNTNTDMLTTQQQTSSTNPIQSSATSDPQHTSISPVTHIAPCAAVV